MSEAITTEINGKTIHAWKTEAEIERAEADRLHRLMTDPVALRKEIVDRAINASRSLTTDEAAMLNVLSGPTTALDRAEKRLDAIKDQLDDFKAFADWPAFNEGARAAYTDVVERLTEALDA